MKSYRDCVRPRGSASPTGGSSIGEEVDEGVLECSLEELAEFLEADLIDVPVDLEFKQTLRNKLWGLVRTRNRWRDRSRR